MLTHIDGAKDAMEVIGSIREALNSPFKLDGQELFATASIGVSLPA